MMGRRTFLALIPGSLAAPLAAEAEQASPMYRVGLVSLGGDPVWWQPVLDAMRELGYVEGRNLSVRRAFAKGHPENLSRLVTELVRSGVDVVVTTAVRETKAVQQAAPSTPIVMLLVPDPVAEGFVTTLARPGGNVTGLTNLAPGLTQKYVELLREAVPSASRFVVVASNPAGPPPQVRGELERAAKTFGIVLSISPVSGPQDFDAVLARAKREGAAGIIVVGDYLTFQHRKRFVEAVLKYRLPGIYWTREYVDEGGLLAYSADMTDLRRRAATFVDKILKGAKPADLPVEQPTKFELVINLKTAKTLGLTIPPSLLARADQVIE
ncbi:MAG TPA: ABC transporter substrate-binding protein [Polyangiaceae bacterium]|nr:ABC transporter substrate-binding protein [Polyangiaceae bacterium]